MAEITQEMIDSLANLLNTLQDSKKYEEIQLPTREEFFERYWKYAQENLPLSEMSVKEIAKTFFMQAASTEFAKPSEIPMEQLIEEVESIQFLEDVKSWMECKEKYNWATPPENPFVTVIKKICPCGECLAHQELICDGDPNCEVEVEEQINLNEVIGKNPQVT